MKPRSTANRICVLNRKGGVGKTTLSIALAETLVWERRANVLLVDLDPQGSATEVLLSEADFEERMAQERTLPGFLQRLIDSETLDVATCVAGMVHALTDRAHVRLDMLPNSSDLYDLEFHLPHRSREKYKRTFNAFLDELSVPYDWVIVDCPPGRLYSAEAAVEQADFVLCPVLPDRLSEWGMRTMCEFFEGKSTPWKFVVNQWSGKPEAKRFYRRVIADESSGMQEVLLGVNTLASSDEADGVERPFAKVHASDRFVRRTERFYVKPREKASLMDLYGAPAIEDLSQVLQKIEKEVAGHG